MVHLINGQMTKKNNTSLGRYCCETTLEITNPFFKCDIKEHVWRQLTTSVTKLPNNFWAIIDIKSCCCAKLHIFTWLNLQGSYRLKCYSQLINWWYHFEIGHKILFNDQTIKYKNAFWGLCDFLLYIWMQLWCGL